MCKVLKKIEIHLTNLPYLQVSFILKNIVLGLLGPRYLGGFANCNLEINECIVLFLRNEFAVGSIPELV